MKTNPPQKKKVYANVTQCASAEGVDVDMLRLAKTVGCPGFTSSGRVEWETVSAWISKNDAFLKEKAKGSLNYWKIEKLKFDAKRSEHAFECQRGAYFKKDEVLTWIKSAHDIAREKLISKCNDELLPRLIGVSEQEMQNQLTAFCNDVCESLKVESWVRT